MKAFQLTGYGKNTIELRDVPEPILGPTQVLIENKGGSVNPVDFKIRDGELKRVFPFELPATMGNDIAGTILKVGSEVTRFKVGDDVVCSPGANVSGTFAERVTLEDSMIALKPQNLSFTEAASLALVSLTAWQAFTEKSLVKEGSKVLVHGGTGGLGSAAIQIAKALGAEVATTVSGSKTQIARDLGADLVIDYRTEDFSQKLSGYDVVLDTQGGDTLAKSFSVVKRGGTVVSVVGPPTPDFARQVGKGFPLTAITSALSFKTRRLAKKNNATFYFLLKHPSGEQLAKITELIEDGKIKPLIDKEFEFDQTLQALSYLEEGKVHAGKVVIHGAK